MSSMQWTADRHLHFVQVVKQLGGEKRAKPSKILEIMNRGELTIDHVKSHLQWYRNTKRKEAIQEEANLIMQMNYWETQQHFHRYEQMLKTAEMIKTQQRHGQEKEMHEKIVEFGESSNKTKEVSCKSLYQSSRIGLCENENNTNDKEGNIDETSLKLILGLKY